jgi:hypothetical protein
MTIVQGRAGLRSPDIVLSVMVRVLPPEAYRKSVSNV